jgi:hypothetical protein
MTIWRAGMRAVCVRRDLVFELVDAPGSEPEVGSVYVVASTGENPYCTGYCALELLGQTGRFAACCFRPVVDGEAELEALREIAANPGTAEPMRVVAAPATPELEEVGDA